MQILPFGEYGLNLAVLLISVMLSVGGIVLGIGYATESKRFKEFGKEEIVQSVINGALVGGLLILFSNGGVVNAFMNSVVMQNGTSISCDSFLAYNSALCFAYNYLVGPNQFYFLGASHNSILSDVMGMTTGLIALYAVLGLLKTFLSPLLSQIQSTVQVLGAAAVSATVQASVLMAIAASALSIILPLGLILRTFYPTRRLGGFLIALSIGLYVVLPLTYVMNAAISSSYRSATDWSGVSAVTLATQTIQSSILSSLLSGASNSTILSFVSGISSWISTLLASIFNTMAYLIVYVFILPAFSLMMTGISVRELAALLGSETFYGKFNLL